MTEQPLSLQDPDWRSSDVIGSGTFHGPLVWYAGRRRTDEELEVLQRLDARFARSGYILYAESQDVWELGASAHCRCRLSRIYENLSSHPVTYMRLQIAEAPGMGYVVATSVRGQYHCAPDETYADGKISVWQHAHLEANGRAMALKVSADGPR